MGRPRIAPNQRLQITLRRLADLLAPHIPEARARIDDLLADCIGRFRPATLTGLESDLRRWLDWWCGEPRSDLALENRLIEAYVQELGRQAKRESTVARAVSSLRLVVRALSSQDHEERHVCQPNALGCIPSHALWRPKRVQPQEFLKRAARPVEKHLDADLFG